MGRLHYIIDDAFGDMIDKEIERSMLSSVAVKKQKHHPNKSKLEHEEASAISRAIGETREFALFRNDALRRLQSTLTDLVDNFDEEFPLTLSTSSTALGTSSDRLILDNGKGGGTGFELSEIIEARYPGGGDSSTYNVSYGSDSEASFANGSGAHHVCFLQLFSLLDKKYYPI